jgi:hypothetical protein
VKRSGRLTLGVLAVGLSLDGTSGVATASPETPRQVVKQYIADINRGEWRGAWKLLDGHEHREIGTVAQLTSGLLGSNDRITHLGPGHITGSTAQVSLRMFTSQNGQVNQWNVMYRLVRDGGWRIDNVGNVTPPVVLSSTGTTVPTIPTTTTVPPQQEYVPPSYSYTPPSEFPPTPLVTATPPPQTVACNPMENSQVKLDEQQLENDQANLANDEREANDPNAFGSSEYYAAQEAIGSDADAVQQAEQKLYQDEADAC